MSNSKLVTYTNLSKDKSTRKSKIDSVIIHCIVAQWTAKQCCDYFATSNRDCSANYCVGKDGSIGLSVEEQYRAWCSGGTDSSGNPIRVNGISGADFDHRAIAIEVASDSTHPYAVTDKAMSALIDLLVDICQRNGIKQLLWKADKSLVGQVDKQNMGAHRWFANKACPGDYLYNRFGQIASEVNERLGVVPDTNVGDITTSDECPFAVGDTVDFTASATKYNPAGAGIPAWVKNSYSHIVTAITSNGKAVTKGGERCVLLGKKVNKTTSKTETGINTWVSVKVLQRASTTAAEAFKSYRVKVTTDELNIRKGPGTGFSISGNIKDRGVYTIVLEDATGQWGKLKSGAGWISLAYTTKV